MNDRDSEITAAVLRERAKLWSFIRRRVPDPGEAEDILQDVFFDFVRAYRLPEPIEQAAAWLFRVARNRLIDRFRKNRSSPATVMPVVDHTRRAPRIWTGAAINSPSEDPRGPWVFDDQISRMTFIPLVT